MSAARGGAILRGAGLAAALVLAACAAPDTSPKRLPPTTGASIPVQIGAKSYIVTRSTDTTAPNDEVMRVYRIHAPAFDYSEGLTARAVAEAFCARYNRAVARPESAVFEPTGDWLFPGGCA